MNYTKDRLCRAPVAYCEECFYYAACYPPIKKKSEEELREEEKGYEKYSKELKEDSDYVKNKLYDNRRMAGQ